MNAAISIAHTYVCDFLDPHCQQRLVLCDGLVIVDRLGSCRTAQVWRKLVPKRPIRSSTSERLREGLVAFLSTSWSMALSSDRSATKWLSLAFSSSSCRSRCSSGGPNLLYFLRQLKKVASDTPILRQTSSTGVPNSACFRAKVICFWCSGISLRHILLRAVTKCAGFPKSRLSSFPVQGQRNPNHDQTEI